MTAAEHVRLLRGLRAVRRFARNPLPQHVIDDVLEVARWTGSTSNRPPWELILLRDKEILHRVGALPNAAGLRHVAKAAAAVVLVPTGHLTEFDEGRWTERVMLAAAAHGLGAGIARVPEEHATAVAHILAAPPERVIRTLVSLGYPADARARLVGAERETEHGQALLAVGRKPRAKSLHVDRYRRLR